MDYDDYQELQRLRQVAKIFKGTILNGLLEMEEEDLLDSDLEIEKGDRVLGPLDDLEKRIQTLIGLTWNKACEVVPGLMIDGELDFLIGSCYEENVDEIISLREDVMERYLAKDEIFPEEDWIELLFICDRAGHIMRIFNDVVMSRFPKKDFEAFVVKKGFQIVVDKDDEYLITSFSFPTISPN